MSAGTERHDVVIVGGGQAGLAMSYYLRELGREHVIVERARVGERWRSERWDSLCFQFPNWALRLPGFAYNGDDPNGFVHHGEVTRFIEAYAAHLDAPLCTGVDVGAVEADPKGGFILETSNGMMHARSVVLATGGYHEAPLPVLAENMPRDLVHLRASRYRNPAQLPDGAVLIVGSGSSGAQIAEELAEAGRTVYLCVGRHRRAPRAYRGRDLLSWLIEIGWLAKSIEEMPSRRAPPPLVVTGVRGGHDVNFRAFPRLGVRLAGRLRGCAGGVLSFEDDLEERLSEADSWSASFTDAVDAHIARSGLVTRDPVPEETFPPTAGPLQLDLRRAGVSGVLWCTGYGLDFGWLHVPVIDVRGRPVQRRGITSVPGLYFLGLHWLHSFYSSTIFGVGDDARYIAENIGS